MAHPFITDAQATQKIQESYNDIVNSIGTGFQGSITTTDTPTEGGVYIPTEAGTYPNAGNLEYDPEGEDEGYLVMFIYDGDWTKNVTPINFTPTGVIEEGNTQAVSGGKVYDKLTDYAMPLDSNRILPEGDEFVDIDRPDLEKRDFSLIFTDVNNDVIAEIYDTKLFIESGYDRPDLGVVYIDFLGYILASAQSGGDTPAPPVVETPFEPVFFEPTDAPAFYLNTSPYDTYENYIDAFDSAVNFSTWSSAFPDYVTKSSIGKTTNDNLDIYVYEFKPKNPKAKLLITSTIHGVEKFVAAAMLRFAEDLCKNWMNYETLKWFRANVHLVLAPIANPEGFNNLSRRILETAPFNASWSKSGNTVTLTFNEADFPTNNPNIQASNYFNAHAGVAGRVWVSLIDSSDETSVPNSGYLIQSVVDGQTITFTSTEGGVSSGTCKIYISADPNRGYDTTAKPWVNATPSSNMQAYNEPVDIPISNKGTRPYSTKETVALRNLIEANEDAIAHIDYHNGAARYDTRVPFSDVDTSHIQEYNELHAQFTSLNMPIQVSPLTTNSMVSESASLGIPSKTVEWGGFDTATALNGQVTSSDWKQGYRWLTNTLLNTVKKYKK